MSDSPSSNSGPSPGVIETTDNKPNAEPTPHTHDNATSPPNEGKSKSTDGQEGGGNEGASPAADIPQTPQVALTFLLVSGKRRTMVFEPDTTIGRVKELAWNSWPTGKLFSGPLAVVLLLHILLNLGSLLFGASPSSRLCCSRA
ncbi:hypothetical protein AX16_004661 [Volvariella volvacea WC 439]|nr:hypothetical protein AX16_004661 [Volvariella volvacea WC 439]